MRLAIGFYFSQFLFGFCRHIPLIGAMLLIVGLMFVPDVNQSFGLRYLIWHENPVKQAAVGFALGVLVVQTLLAGYLLETQRTLPDDRVCLRRAGPALTYGIGIVTCLALTAAPVILTGDIDWLNSLQSWPLMLGYSLAFGLYLLALQLLPTERGSHTWVASLGHALFDGMSQIRLLHVPKAEDTDMPLHGVAVLAQAFAVLTYFAVGVGPLGLFSPLVGVLALAGMAIAGYGFFEYFLARVQPALILLLLGLVFLGGLNRYQSHFPDLDPLYDAPVSLKEYNPFAKVELLSPEEVDFCGQARGPYVKDQKRPLVVVCVSGGGLRAGAWATAVLHRLEAKFAAEGIDFPCHIRIITGASGGMVGAGYYVANLPDPPPTPLNRGDLRPQYDALTEDCLSPIVHAMTYQDIRSTFSPFGRPRDRGQALEAAWSNQLKNVLDLTFQRLQAGERAGWRPSLVFSPMLVEDGRRLLISNLDLRGAASNDGMILQEFRDHQTDPSLLLRRDLNRFSIESYELFRLFPDRDTARKFRVATAARMSATFPFISPAVALPTEPRRRVVDAGYYDNDGISLAASWLFSGANRDWLRKHVSKIALIQIRDGASEPGRKLMSTPEDKSSPLSRGIELLSTPASGLFNARVGSSSFRNDGLLEVLSQQLINDMQLKPIISELEAGEIKLLFLSKERELLQATLESMSAEKAAQIRAALAERKQQYPGERMQEKFTRIEKGLDNRAQAASERAKWSQTMSGVRFEDPAEKMIDRLVRDVELQAASVEITPKDAELLINSFERRLKSRAEAVKLYERVKKTYDRKAGCPYFVTVAFEYNGAASLSWYLTQAEKDDIHASTDRTDERIQMLIDWWKQPTAQDGQVLK